MYGTERRRHVLDTASTLGNKAGVRAYQIPGKSVYMLSFLNALFLSCVEWSDSAA